MCPETRKAGQRVPVPRLAPDSIPLELLGFSLCSWGESGIAWHPGLGVVRVPGPKWVKPTGALVGTDWICAGAPANLPELVSTRLGPLLSISSSIDQSTCPSQGESQD